MKARCPCNSFTQSAVAGDRIGRCECGHFAESHGPDDGLCTVVLEPAVRRHPDGGYGGTVVNDGQPVDFRDMLTEPWMPELADRLFKTLGRKYLAHQLVSMLPADVALRLVDRVDEVVEHQVSTAVERIHQDVDGAVALTLARLAESADTKRREISRERFTTPSRLS